MSVFSIPSKQVKHLVEEHETKRGVYRFFTEVAGSIRRSDLFEAIFATLIVTMLALAVGRFFLLPFYYALPAPVVYLVARIVLIQRTDVLGRTERAFPEFREQLITIRDNFGKTHEMEDALERDVLARSRDVTSAGFFDARGFSLKIIVILLLFFATGFVTQFSYHDVPPFWNALFPHKPPAPAPTGGNITFFERMALTGPNSQSQMNSTSATYGDKSPLLQGTKQVPIQLQAAKNALDLSTSTSVKTLDTFQSYTPTRIDAVGAQYYEESIPVNKQAVVQNYFKALSG